jgi:FMN phosphatase YigB (HAD superfamily)
MGRPPLKAALVDVGGTLWPNTWVPTDAERATRLAAVASVLPGADEADLAAAIEALTSQIEGDTGTQLRRAAVDLIRESLGDHGWPCDPDTVRAFRQGLCAKLGAVITPFDGAADLLAGIKELGLGCVILSNTTFRDAEIYGRDFSTLGWDRWLDGCVTSVDAGWAKPDRRIFKIALERAGTPAESCVMIGDSEIADIRPALELGLRTIRVAIEETMTDSSAHATATSPTEALGVIRSWL